MMGKMMGYYVMLLAVTLLAFTFAPVQFIALAPWVAWFVRALSVLILVIGLILCWRQAKHSVF